MRISAPRALRARSGRRGSRGKASYFTVPYGTGTRAGTLCRSLCERGGKWNPVNGMSLYAASRVTGPAEDLHTILYGGPSRDD